MTHNEIAILYKQIRILKVTNKAKLGVKIRGAVGAHIVPSHFLSLKVHLDRLFCSYTFV